MGILSLIASQNFIAVNKTLIRELGLECAVLLGELASESDFFSDDKQDGFFYATVEKIKDNTGLSGYQQRKAIDKLCSLGILESRLMGCPAKRYLKISCENLQNQFLKNSRTSSQKTSELDVKNFQNSYKNISIRNNNKEAQCTNRARTRIDTPPSLAKAEEEDNAAVDEMTLHGQYPETWEEVKVEAVRFGIEMQQEEAEAFLAKYASVGWLNKFGHKITNWRILLKTWHNNWAQIEKDKKERTTGGKNGCYIRGSTQGVRDPYIEGRFNVEGDGYESNDWERFFGKGDNPGDGEKRNDEAGS